MASTGIGRLAATDVVRQPANAIGAARDRRHAAVEASRFSTSAVSSRRPGKAATVRARKTPRDRSAAAASRTHRHRPRRHREPSERLSRAPPGTMRRRRPASADRQVPTKRLATSPSGSQSACSGKCPRKLTICRSPAASTRTPETEDWPFANRRNWLTSIALSAQRLAHLAAGRVVAAAAPERRDRRRAARP